MPQLEAEYFAPAGVELASIFEWAHEHVARVPVRVMVHAHAAGVECNEECRGLLPLEASRG